MKRAKGKHDADRHVFMRLMHTCRGDPLSIRWSRRWRLESTSCRTGPVFPHAAALRDNTEQYVQHQVVFSEGQQSNNFKHTVVVRAQSFQRAVMMMMDDAQLHLIYNTKF